MNKMKIEGDLSAKHESAGAAFFKRKIKGSGKGNMPALAYRKPKIEGGQGPHAV